VSCADGIYVDISADQAYVDGKLINAPVSASPVAGKVPAVLGTRIEFYACLFRRKLASVPREQGLLGGQIPMGVVVPHLLPPELHQ
jgi:hypothetical protein